MDMPDMTMTTTAAMPSATMGDMDMDMGGDHSGHMGGDCKISVSSCSFLACSLDSVYLTS